MGEGLREVADQTSSFPGTEAEAVVLLPEREEAIVRAGTAVADFGDEFAGNPRAVRRQPNSPSWLVSESRRPSPSAFAPALSLAAVAAGVGNGRPATTSDRPRVIGSSNQPCTILGCTERHALTPQCGRTFDHSGRSLGHKRYLRAVSNLPRPTGFDRPSAGRPGDLPMPRPLPRAGHRRKSQYALAALGLFPLLLLSAVAGGCGPRSAPPSLAIPTAVPLDPSPFAAPPTPRTAPSTEVCCDKSSDDKGKIVAVAALEPRTEVVPAVAAHPVPDPNPVAASAPEPEVRQGPSEQRLRDLRSTIEHRRRRHEAGAARQRERCAR